MWWKQCDVEGKTIPVTGKEVLDFYGKHCGIKQATLEIHAACYACHINYHKEYCDRTLDKSLVKRLLDEERPIKKDETKIQIICNIITYALAFLKVLATAS